MSELKKDMFDKLEAKSVENIALEQEVNRLVEENQMVI